MKGVVAKGEIVRAALVGSEEFRTALYTSKDTELNIDGDADPVAGASSQDDGGAGPGDCLEGGIDGVIHDTAISGVAVG